MIACIFMVSVDYIFGDTSNWTITQALTLGSILAATDPVAVVGALHELGAPAALSTVIEGESLLNDGSAMVLFSIFSNMGFHNEDYSVVCCISSSILR